jgi:integrase
MRISECLGIEWKNVDLDTGIIRLERQSIQVHGKPGVHLEPLKTDTSRRIVRVPPIVCAILRRHLELQTQEEAAARRRGTWVGQGTVFCTVNGRLYARNTAGQQFRDIRYRLDLGEDVTLHTFRHTVATLLQESGHPIRAAQVLLGHSTDATTLRVYSHPTRDTLERIAATMGAMFAESDMEIIDAEIVSEDRLLMHRVS